jgi:branched-chain amino acid transport system ATP-binding protein
MRWSSVLIWGKIMLSIRNLSVYYGEAIALRDINISVEDGKIVTIIGANGAGKTTLVNTIAGILRAREGEITLNNHPLAHIAPHKVCDYGIAIVPEGRRLFTALTVLENLKLGGYPAHAHSAAKATLAWIYEIFPRLAERKRQIAGTLSGGEQQMLAIGRALMAQPKLLLLDEPSLGLAPIVVRKIFEVVEQINRERGMSILLVEQNANKALSVADKAYILSNGQIVREGVPSEFLSDASIKQVYLGLH